MEHVVFFCVGLFTGSSLGVLATVLIRAGAEEEGGRPEPVRVSKHYPIPS